MRGDDDGGAVDVEWIPSPHTLPAWIMIVTVMNRDDDDGDGHRGCQCDGDGAGAIAEDTMTRSARQLESSASKKI